MLKFINYSIVFQEVPNEVTLAINISGCPNNCKGCHSSYLKEDIGEVLDRDVLSGLLLKYKNAITCICFMGGDSYPQTIEQLSSFIKKSTASQIKTAWYSGKKVFPNSCSLKYFDYIKLGPYIEEKGGLNSPFTNQRFYKIENDKMIDKTSCFISERIFASL